MTPFNSFGNLHIQWNGSASKLVVTVPNAFSWLNLRHAVRGCEFINTDHRYWFTPYTLAKGLTCAGFDLRHLSLCEYELPHPSSIIKRGLGLALTGALRFKPILRSCIIAVAEF